MNENSDSSESSGDGDKMSSKDKNQASSRDKDQACSRDEDQASSRDDKANSRVEDQASSRDENQASSRDEDQTRSRDEDQACSRDENQASSNDEDQASSRDDQACSRDEDQACSNVQDKFYYVKREEFVLPKPVLFNTKGHFGLMNPKWMRDARNGHIKRENVTNGVEARDNVRNNNKRLVVGINIRKEEDSDDSYDEDDDESYEESEDDESTDYIQVHSSERPVITKIFVGNISRVMKTSELKRHFRRYGHVTNVYIPRDPRNNSRHRYGFVTFRNPVSAEEALKTKRVMLNNRKIFVSAAHDRHQPLYGIPRPKTSRWSYLSYDDIPSLCTDWSSSESIDSIGSEDCERVEASEPKRVQVEEDVPSITVLNDDCMQHVFKFITKVNLMRLETVCKWWQRLSYESWATVKDFHLSNFRKTYSLGRPNMNMLESLLKHCGRHLSGLDISGEDNDFDVNAVALIARYCPSLEYLNINNLPLCRNSLIALSAVAGNLKTLLMAKCYGANDADRSRLFHKCKNLTWLEISETNTFNGKCLRSLQTENLKTLIFLNCYHTKLSHLLPAFRRMNNLKTLAFNYPLNLGSSQLWEIAGFMPQLEHLCFTGDIKFYGFSVGVKFQNLNNLVSLDVKRNSGVNDSVLEEISLTCINLKTLNISAVGTPGARSKAVTNAGISAIAKLPYLEDLSMSYLKYVTDESLEMLAIPGRLKKLEIRGSPEFTDAGCCKIITYSDNLEHLDVSGSNHITDATVAAAKKAVRLRDKKIALIVGGTRVTEDNWNNPPPLLDLQFVNYCKDQLRADFVNDMNALHQANLANLIQHGIIFSFEDDNDVVNIGEFLNNPGDDDDSDSLDGDSELSEDEESDGFAFEPEEVD